AVAVLVITALIFCGVGFVIGQVVEAVTVMPGGADDPLVSQSYVDTLVGEKTLELQTQLEELQAYVVNGGVADLPDDKNVTDTDTTPNDKADENLTDKGTKEYTAVKVSSNSVNIRSSASTTASIVGNASSGTALTYLGKTTASDGDWYHVKTSNGTEGWVASWVCGKPY
ncbi:MAG: SH3 domain-containing protein, partial [Clostridiales bacterium]